MWKVHPDIRQGMRWCSVIQFCVGHISSPFVEKSFYLSTLTIQIPLMHLQATMSTILQTTIHMKLSFNTSIMIVVINISNNLESIVSFSVLLVL